MLSTPETVIWLIRHSASTFNLQGRCQGCCDLPELTDESRCAARLTGERLRNAGIEAIIFSPLRRAAQTAFEIAEALRPLTRNIRMKPDPRLREIELPEWEGLAFAEIHAKFPEQFLTWCRDPWHLQMLSSDGVPQFPVQNLYRRARHIWLDSVARYPGKTILLVSHGGTGRALITSALGLGAKYFHAFQQSNCGLTRLCFAGKTGKTRLELLNDTSHVNNSLPKIKEAKIGIRLLLIPVAGSSLDAFRRLLNVVGRVRMHTVFAAGVGVQAVASLIFQSSCSCAVQQVSGDVLLGRVKEILEGECENELRNVALIASPARLRRVLQDCFDLTALVANAISLTEPGITVVHCPGGGVPTILQGMNMLGQRIDSTGVTS